jgi:DNA mismatch endonuclease (patch repair protein)
MPEMKPVDSLTRVRMQRQRESGTRPELAIREILSALAVRYRLNTKELPGSPDISNKRSGWAIFVHGCFWHHHRGCSRASVPRTNREWWIRKFEANRARDIRASRALRRLGISLKVVWECEIEDRARLERNLRAWVSRCRAKGRADGAGRELRNVIRVHGHRVHPNETPPGP